MANEHVTARKWLVENDYEDIVALIDRVEDDWRSRGFKTRRDWWDILAGDAEGQGRTVAGRVFPVLWAAQRRQGRKPTKNALRRKRSEAPPPVRHTGRWPQHEEPS
jgi:hypothetical protein